MMEFLLVTFTESRVVLADGVPVGVTNHTLMLPPNEYSIRLKGKKNYAPASEDIDLSGTSVMQPLVVHFT